MINIINPNYDILQLLNNKLKNDLMSWINF